MNINIQSPGFTPGEELIDFVKEKIKKLTCFYGEIIGSEVCLRLTSSASGENKTCSIRLMIPGNDLMASSQYKKFEIAIVQTIEVLKRQIKRRKTKNYRKERIISE